MIYTAKLATKHMKLDGRKKWSQFPSFLICSVQLKEIPRGDPDISLLKKRDRLQVHIYFEKIFSCVTLNI